MHPEESMKTFEKLCYQNNLARACSNLAYFYESPIGSLNRNSQKSLESYQKACDLKDGIACNNLANIYIEGIGGVPINLDFAVMRLKESCQYDYAPACYRLSMITIKGKLLANNPVEATRLMKKGCDLGDVISCHDLAYRYINGEGVEHNNQHALELFKYSCDHEFARGCSSLGSYLMMGEITEVNYPEALRLLQKACASEEASACTNLGFMYEMGKGVKIDFLLSAKYSEQACLKGDDFGCGNLGNLYARGKGIEKNEKIALPLLNKGCSEKNAESCRYLAKFHTLGLGGLPRVKKTALFYQKQACEFGDLPSCETLEKNLTSLCKKNEKITLSCQINKNQFLSLCLKSINVKNSSLVYRLGTKAQIKIQYNDSMILKKEIWGNGELYELSFSKDNTQYKLTESISKTTDPVTRKIQIVSNKSKPIECLHPIKGTFIDDKIFTAINVKNE